MLVSVVIPVRDAEQYLPACLEQLVRQDYPHDNLEVIVVDGMSRDATVQVAESYPLGTISKKIVRCQSIGRSQGLNAGIRAATGRAICRLDARTRIEPDYISVCAKTLLATGAANVGGLQVPEGKTPAQIAIGLAMSHPFGVGNAQFRIAKDSGYVDTVYLGFFRRDIFDRVGYFDEKATVLSEDSDLNQRIRAAGEKIYLIASLRARYEPRGSLLEQFALYFRYGGARAGNILKHGNVTSLRQLAAPGMLAGTVVLALASLWLPATAVLLLGALGFYGLVDLLVSLKLTWSARQPRLFFYLLASFPCMHWAYGLGFWRRLLDPRGTTPWKG